MAKERADQGWLIGDSLKLRADPLIEFFPLAQRVARHPGAFGMTLSCPLFFVFQEAALMPPCFADQHACQASPA